MKSLILSALFFLCLSCLPAAAGQYRPVPVALHVHSTWSPNGTQSIEQIAAQARAAGVQAVILSDHDIVKCTYGLPPFRNLVKRTVEYPSVLKNGPEEFLKEIERVNKAYPDVLLIPGVESTPYYFWTGNPLKKNLTLNDWHKHLLVAGLYRPEDYRRLPVLGNEASAGRVNILLLWPLVLILAGLLLMKKRKTAGRALFYAGALIAFINFPFTSLPFNQYHRQRSEAPYQRMIDHVARTAPETGLVFWAHPDAPNFDTPQQVNGVSLLTREYPDALLATAGYTGFGYFQEGRRTAGAVGGTWDRLLTDYCSGKRNAPVWAAGELDYRSEGLRGTYIDSFKNIVLLPSGELLTPSTLTAALRAGRFYVTAKPAKGPDLVLEEFAAVSDNGTAVMGETLKAEGAVQLSIKLRLADNSRRNVRLSVISEGGVMETRDSLTPIALQLLLPQHEKRTWYRLEAAAGEAQLITNPIFIDH